MTLMMTVVNAAMMTETLSSILLTVEGHISVPI